MMYSVTLAGTFQGNPAATFSSTPVLIALLVAAVLAIICIIASVITFLPRTDKNSHQNEHKKAVGGADFTRRVQTVNKSFDAGKISKTEAFHELAAIARQFASTRLHTDITSHTLADLEHMKHAHTQHAEGMNLLRSTIEGLYPPEFAYEATNARSAQVTVNDACRWVTSVIERWDA